MSLSTLNVLETALELNAHGFTVVPIGEGKRPPLPWKQYQHTQPQRQDVQDWFTSHPEWGLGVLTGTQANLLMVEIEGRAAQFEDKLAAFAHANGYGRIWERLTHGWVERTPSGGTHFYARCTQPIEGNKKLARRPLTDEERQAHPGQRLTVLAETRGEGGLSVIAPTPGSLHPTGRPWEALRGSAATCPTFTPEEIEAVYAIFASIDSTPKPEPEPQTTRARTRMARSDGRVSTFEDYDNKTSWEDILIPAGWTIHHHGSDGTVFWTRPGKNPTQGVSATTGFSHEADRLYVFSTSTEFESEHPYSKAQAYAHIHHAGNLSAAAKDLYTQGYGDRFEPSKRLTPRVNRRAPGVHTEATSRTTPYPTRKERSDMATSALARISSALTSPDAEAIANATGQPNSLRRGATAPTQTPKRIR